MPFTPSHAIAALPFIRTPIVPAAVAVGAMAPDLPLFVRGTPLRYGWTHDLRWLPATMAVAFALFLLWRYVLRPGVPELTPQWVARRLPQSWAGEARAVTRETFPSAAGVLFLVLALAIGVASHIVWDLFTHEGRGGVLALPALEAQWGPLVGYKWLQHGSSVVGMMILAVWATGRLLRAVPVTSLTRILPSWVRWTLWLSLPGILIAASIAGYLLLGPFSGSFTWQHLAYAVLPPACAGWGLATVALCVTVLALRAAGVRGPATPDRPRPTDAAH